MNTFKNFIIGLVVLLAAAVIFAVIFLTWPMLIGISSFILSVIAAALFVVFLFYIVVFIGHLTRLLIRGQEEE